MKLTPWSHLHNILGLADFIGFLWKQTGKRVNHTMLPWSLWRWHRMKVCILTHYRPFASDYFASPNEYPIAQLQPPASVLTLGPVLIFVTFATVASQRTSQAVGTDGAHVGFHGGFRNTQNLRFACSKKKGIWVWFGDTETAYRGGSEDASQSLRQQQVVLEWGIYTPHSGANCLGSPPPNPTHSSSGMADLLHWCKPFFLLSFCFLSHVGTPEHCGCALWKVFKGPKWGSGMEYGNLLPHAILKAKPEFASCSWS